METKQAYLETFAENQPDIQSIPYSFKNWYTSSLTYKLHQLGINRDGQPRTRTLLRLFEGQKKPARKNFFGEKYSWKFG